MDDLKGKRFLQVKTLAFRWDYKTNDRIYDLLSRGVLRAWEPEGKPGTSGIRIDVKSILDVESRGYLE